MTFVAWFLISIGGSQGNNLVYSPPLASKEVCEHLKRNAPDPRGYYQYSNCVQLTVVK